MTIGSIATGLAPTIVTGRAAIKTGGRIALSKFEMEAVKLAGSLSARLATAAGHQVLRVFARFKFFRRARASMGDRSDKEEAKSK